MRSFRFDWIAQSGCSLANMVVQCRAAVRYRAAGDLLFQSTLPSPVVLDQEEEKQGRNVDLNLWKCCQLTSTHTHTPPTHSIALPASTTLELTVLYKGRRRLDRIDLCNHPLNLR